MPKTKHTPGPWFYSRDWRQIEVFRTFQDGARHPMPLALLVPPPLSDEELQANARLIAAAPELLDALEKALPYLSKHQCTAPTEHGKDNEYAELYRVMEQCDSAIAKAKGQQ